MQKNNRASFITLCNKPHTQTTARVLPTHGAECYQGKMADPAPAEDVKPEDTQKEYWLTLEEAEGEVKAHEERTGTRYTLSKADPSFGSSCEYAAAAFPPPTALSCEGSCDL